MTFWYGKTHSWDWHWGTPKNETPAASTLIHEDFDHIHDPDYSGDIARDGKWDVRGDRLVTDGRNDGKLVFETQTTEAEALTLSLDLKVKNIHAFEGRDHKHGDTLDLYVLVDGEKILLDSFAREGDRMVGSVTGKSFSEESVTLDYDIAGLSAGAKDVTLVFESDITARNEKIFIDNVKLAEAETAEDAGDGDDTGGDASGTVTLAHEDFDHVHRPEQTEAFDKHTDWEVRHDALYTDEHNDGALVTETWRVEADTLHVSFSAKSAHAGNFEAWEDFVKVFAVIDGHKTLLDDFRTNGHEIVGSETGQSFGEGAYTDIAYQIDLPPGAVDVALKFVSASDYCHEWTKIDDLKVEAKSEEPAEGPCPDDALKIDFEALAKGATEAEINAALDHVTITAERPGGSRDVHLEAEHMHETGFHTVHDADKASGHKFEKLNGDFGKLWDDFHGADGTYEIAVTLQDENDGVGELALWIDGHVVETLRTDGGAEGGGGDDAGFGTYSFGIHDLERGDDVKLTWTKLDPHANHEMGRVDKLSFLHVGGAEGGDAMIFDARHPTGGDHDLAGGDGNVLIVSEDNDSSDPDDNAKGGKVTFDFAVPVTLHAIDVIDTEEGGTITLFDAEGGALGAFDLPRLRDGEVATLDLGGTSGVAQMVVELNGSGAIDNICYDKDGVVETASLGDRVFFDTDRDGIQDAGETGAEGVTVTLTGGGADGVIGTADDTTATTTTDADGLYSFTGLTPGEEYRVTFSDLPEGFEFTTADNETGPAGDAGDSDADPATGQTGIVTLAPGEENLTLDAGLVQQLGSLSGRYFLDENDNDVDDAEPGIAGVRVTLLDAAGNPTGQTTLTAADGSYAFADLPPGAYGVAFSDPDGVLDGLTLVTPEIGGDDSVDSDAVGDTVLSQITGIDVAAGQNTPDNDAGAERTASLGDRVFFDTDRDGIQDAGETGAEGVTVTLTGGGADGVIGTADDTTATTTTDADGLYSFTGLTPGEEYRVTFSDLPEGFEFTTADNETGPAGDAGDSDADPATGQTGIVTLAPGEENLTLDAGLVESNTAPEAANDMAKLCAPGGTKDGAATTGITLIDVLANDGDVDGDAITIAQIAGVDVGLGGSVTLGSGAVVTLRDDASLGLVLEYDAGGATYEVDQDGDGTAESVAAEDLLIGIEAADSFVYAISDGNGGTATATVDVDICGAKNTVETITDRLPDTARINIDLVGGGLGQPVSQSPVSVDFDGDGIVEDDPDSPLDGVYEGFCIELPDPINLDPTDALVYSAYEDLESIPSLAGDIDNRDATTFAQVNYLLDQYLHDTGGFAWQDVQNAIRALTNPQQTPGDGNFDVSTLTGDALMLYDDALATGGSFVPDEDDFVGVIFEPQSGGGDNGQVYIVGIPFSTLAEDCLC